MIKIDFTDGGEVVDCESGVCRIVSGEESIESLLKSRVTDAILELDHPHVLDQLLKKKLKENVEVFPGDIITVNPTNMCKNYDLS